MAATNKNLEEEVAAGRFREDLYYRLNVVELNLPRQEEELQTFLYCVSTSTNVLRRLGIDRLQKFPTKRWRSSKRIDEPGNVRELENVMERLTVFCMDEVVEVDDLPEKLLKSGSTSDVSLELPEEVSTSDK